MTLFIGATLFRGDHGYLFWSGVGHEHADLCGALDFAVALAFDLLARGDPRDHPLHVMHNPERRVSRRSRAELCTYVM
jgi:hypothetical protein